MFTAENHVSFFCDSFSQYGIDLKEWAVAETSDNCSVNCKVAKLLGVPHVACHNHLLNSEVQNMVVTSRNDTQAEDKKLAATVDGIQETMA